MKSESEIQRDIMNYLKRVSNSKTIRLDGQGIMVKGRMVRSNKTLLDVLFLYNAQAYFFEIKTPSEKEFIIKHRERILEGNFSGENKNLKRFKRQLEEINEIRSTGNVAEFVCSLDEVIKIIN